MNSNISLCSKNTDNENIINCNYFNIEEIQTLNKLINQSALSLFHVNTCSLPMNLEDLEYLIDKTKINFHVIAISESQE